MLKGGFREFLKLRSKGHSFGMYQRQVLAGFVSNDERVLIFLISSSHLVTQIT